MDATMENLARWIDELAGDIEILRKKVNKAGGDTVTITPALESGTKVADYSIGETEGSLYAPAIPEGLYPFIVDDTNEHVIGKDGNGKEIYCKRVNITALPSTTFTFVPHAHGIANIDKILAYFGFIDFSSGSVSNTIYTMFGSNGFSPTGSVYAYIDSTNIHIQVGQDRSSTGAHFIIFYTKTPPIETKKGGKKK